MALTLLAATALLPGTQSLLHSVWQLSRQTVCTENKMGNQGVGFSHYVDNINSSLNVNQFLEIDKPFTSLGVSPTVWPHPVVSRAVFPDERVCVFQMTRTNQCKARGMEQVLYQCNLWLTRISTEERASGCSLLGEAIGSTGKGLSM